MIWRCRTRANPSRKTPLQTRLRTLWRRTYVVDSNTAECDDDDTYLLNPYRYIDVNYHWNEWELRRRALKVVNLKGRYRSSLCFRIPSADDQCLHNVNTDTENTGCKTTSQQTDESHFKRDSDTQVYEQRTNATQTKVPYSIFYFLTYARTYLFTPARNLYITLSEGKGNKSSNCYHIHLRPARESQPAAWYRYNSLSASNTSPKILLQYINACIHT